VYLISLYKDELKQIFIIKNEKGWNSKTSICRMPI